MSDDVLNQVLLTQAAVDAWQNVAINAGMACLALGIAPATLPDEKAEALPDGRLRIHITTPDGELSVELFIPAEQWSWMHA